MGIKHQIEISPLVCIHPTNGLEICPIQSNFEHPTQAIETPTLSHETTLVTIAPSTVEDLFVHHYQTDQLLVIRGKAVFVIL